MLSLIRTSYARERTSGARKAGSDGVVVHGGNVAGLNTGLPATRLNEPNSSWSKAATSPTSVYILSPRFNDTHLTADSESGCH